MTILKTSLLISAWVVCLLLITPYAEGKCDPVGFSCDDKCENVQYCQTASQEFVPLACDSTKKKFCLIKDGMPSCDGKFCEKITCAVAGPIPSPSSCSNYYICDKSGSKTPSLQTCPTNTKFDTRTKTCTTDSGCKVQKCAAADAGKQGDMINFCYTCIGESNFVIMECPRPTVPPTDAPTVPPTDAPTVPPTDAPTVPPTDAPTVPPTDAPTVPPTDAPTVPPTDSPTVPPTTSPVTCTVANEKLANSADCRSYYICVQVTSGLQAQSFTCRTGMIYNQQRRSCITGTC